MTHTELYKAHEHLYPVLREILYKDWEFYIKYDETRAYLQIEWETICNETGAPCRASSRKWFLSQHMTPSEFAQTCLKAVLTAEEHEARELFKYKGKPIFGPHFDIEHLVGICHLPTAERKPHA